MSLYSSRAQQRRLFRVSDSANICIFLIFRSAISQDSLDFTVNSEPRFVAIARVPSALKRNKTAQVTVTFYCTCRYKINLIICIIVYTCMSIEDQSTSLTSSGVATADIHSAYTVDLPHENYVRMPFLTTTHIWRSHELPGVQYSLAPGRDWTHAHWFQNHRFNPLGHLQACFTLFYNFVHVYLNFLSIKLTIICSNTINLCYV